MEIFEPLRTDGVIIGLGSLFIIYFSGTFFTRVSDNSAHKFSLSKTIAAIATYTLIIWLELYDHFGFMESFLLSLWIIFIHDTVIYFVEFVDNKYTNKS